MAFTLSGTMTSGMLSIGGGYSDFYFVYLVLNLSVTFVLGSLGELSGFSVSGDAFSSLSFLWSV